jgi:hypothetical protein
VKRRDEEGAGSAGSGLGVLGFGASGLSGTGLRLMVKAVETGALEVVAVAVAVAVAVEVVAVAAAAREVVAISDVSEPDSTAAYRVV